MRIICAPDSFKESITAPQAAEAMARGVRAAGAGFDPDVCPVADGGEGTLDALIGALDGRIETARVTGPLGEPIMARLGIVPHESLGIVELAEASGLAKLDPDQRDPTRTTTFGTGELIQNAVHRGCDTVIVCLGGSATVDGATGMAQALGARFFDANGDAMTEAMCGGMLRSIARIELPDPDTLPRIRVACDVTNPLCGPNGAAAVYGPQKGATPEQVRDLDAGLAHVAALLDVNPDQPGSGSAGGAGFGLVAMLGATLERGIELVLDEIGFDERCSGVALVLTGEGRLDQQTLSGKASMGVAHRARRFGVPTIAIVGSTGDGAEHCTDPSQGGDLTGYVALADRFGAQRAMREAGALIEQITVEVIQSQLNG